MTLLLLAFACSNPTAPASAPRAADTVVAVGPSVRAMAPGQDASAAYFTLVNGGTVEQSLVKASAPGVRAVELHGVFEENGLMSMRPVASVPVPAGGSVALEPGGLHVMLLGVDHPLAAGETLALTLTFADGSALDVSAPVK